MVGLLIMLAWFVGDIAVKLGRMNLIVAAAICCLTCAALTARQTAFWRNPETLYAHTIEVTTDNPWANANLGEYLMTQPGRRADALDRLRTALRINPDDATANYNYGTCLLESDLSAEAIPYLETALRIRPDYANAHLNLAMSLSKVSGREEEAVEHYRAGLRLAPEVANGHRYLSELLLKLGRTDEAKAEMEAAQRLHP
jgi:tetratricopeptide (TPR) repeat protein